MAAPFPMAVHREEPINPSHRAQLMQTVYPTDYTHPQPSTGLETTSYEFEGYFSRTNLQDPLSYHSAFQDPSQLVPGTSQTLFTFEPVERPLHQIHESYHHGSDTIEPEVLQRAITSSQHPPPLLPPHPLLHAAYFQPCSHPRLQPDPPSIAASAAIARNQPDLPARLPAPPQPSQRLQVAQAIRKCQKRSKNAAQISRGPAIRRVKREQRDDDVGERVMVSSLLLQTAMGVRRSKLLPDIPTTKRRSRAAGGNPVRQQTRPSKPRAGITEASTREQGKGRKRAQKPRT